jgi:hypothetical protein
MAKSCLKRVFFMLVVGGLATGYAFASDGNLEAPCFSLQFSQEECPQDDRGDAQGPSSNDSDQDETEDDDDTPVIQDWNHLPLSIEVNIIYQLQFALYKEHQVEVVSPPPKS